MQGLKEVSFLAALAVPQAAPLSPIGCSWGPQRVCTALIGAQTTLGGGMLVPPSGVGAVHSPPAQQPQKGLAGALCDALGGHVSFAALGLVQHCANTYAASLESSSCLG